MMKKLLIIGAGLYQIPAITMAREMGYFVIASDISPIAQGLPFANKSYLVSTRDYEGNLKIAIKEKIDGVMSIVSETAVVTVAKIAEKLNLPGIGFESAINATNKISMIACMKKHDVPCPAAIEIRNKQDAKKFLQEHQGPWVIKPTDSSGQRGISLLKNDIELDRAVRFAQSCSVDGTVIIEEFIEGPEINSTAVILNDKIHILSLSNRITLPPPHFGIAIRHIAPPDLSNDNIKDIEDIAIKATKALGFKNGVTYPQIVFSPSGPKLIEIAARVPGGFMNEVALYQSGISMVRTSIKQALGEPVNYCNAIEEKKIPAVSVRFVTQLDLNPTIKRVRDISGIDEIKKMNGIKECFWDLKIGDKIPKLTSSWGRFGAIIGVGETRDEAIALTNTAFKKLIVR